ncbi:tyrosine-type recombinase/integrase [Corallococcus sp. bb12-1]|uniref:tyrosine-type recombinase/integrase n=1 Tax=Corallococcus sp. bb12-1 TaxID=2996784 RepID=UPI00226F26E6|nr:tyrosine-type recombinase/integrase [Corallococcus sp. bb12-1]MCY1047554.1 tyrosine-type recombinase/integrase [Corallococcus sp. bb12-1]
MAYVFKRGAAWYGGWIGEDGHPVKERLPAATKTEAKRLAADKELKAWRIVSGLEEAPRPDMTVSAGIALRLALLPPEYKTKRRQAELLAHVEREMGQKLLRQVRAVDVLTMLSKLGHLEPQTREHIRMAGQGLFTFLTKKANAHVGDNPFKEAGPVEVAEREPGYFTPEQFARLIHVMKPHLAAASLFSALTGTRKAEVRKALKADTHLAERYVLLRGNKNKKDRRVPIPEVLVELLEQQLKAPGKYLFCRPDGRQYTNNWRVHEVISRACVRARLIQGAKPYCYRKACGWKGDEVPTSEPMNCPKCSRAVRWKQVPLPLRFKELRSTYATLGYAATGDLHFVQKVLGHSDPKLTQRRYARALPERLLAGANALGNLLLPAPNLGSPVGVISEAAGATKGTSENSPTDANSSKNEGMAMLSNAREARESQCSGLGNRRSIQLSYGV